MRCTNCGSEIQPGSKFCVNCGAPAEQNAAPAGMPGGMPAPQKAVVRQKKKMSPAILALIIVGVVGVMAAAGFFIGKYVLNDDPGSDKTASESKDVAKEDSSDSEESTADKNEEQETKDVFKLVGVEEGNAANYDVLKQKKNYKKCDKDEDFSFLYPMGFFSQVKKEESGDRVTYKFLAKDNATEIIYEKYNLTGDPMRTVQQLDREMRNRITYNDITDEDQIYVAFYNKDNEVSYKNGSYSTVVSGVPDDSPGIEEYQCNVADNSKVYRMIVRMKEEEADENTSLRGAYMLDCLYRGFSESHLQKPIRNYEQFVDSGDY